MKQQSKNIFYYLFAFSILLAVSVPLHAKTGVSGKTVTLSGTVEVDGQNAFKGMIVHPRATIKTYEGSFIEIVFNEKNIFKIFENSEATLNLDSEERSIRLTSGAIANILKRLDALRERFKPRYTVATATAVAGVRGTVFFVRVEDKENTYICVCNGEIQITDTSGANKTIIAEKHHKAVRFTRKQGKTVISSAGMLYHTDEGVEKLAEKINEKIDWENIGTPDK